MQVYKCCCWSLKTGVLILGIVEIIRFLFILAWTMIDYNNLEQNYTEYINNTDYLYESDEDDEPDLLYFYIPICFIMLLLTSFMIFGSQKNKYKFMLPHCCVNISIVTTFVITQLYKVVLQFTCYKDFEYGFVLLTKALLFNSYEVYFCVIEFSRIKEIKGSKNIIYPLVL